MRLLEHSPYVVLIAVPLLFAGAAFGLRAGDTPKEASQLLSYKGTPVRKSDRVRIKVWAGFFEPSKTGHSEEVHGDQNRTGTIVGLVNEANATVLVRWDEQEWREAGPPVDTMEAIQTMEGVPDWPGEPEFRCSLVQAPGFCQRGSGSKVRLKSFQSSINMDWLEITGNSGQE